MEIDFSDFQSPPKDNEIGSNYLDSIWGQKPSLSAYRSIKNKDLKKEAIKAIGQSQNINFSTLLFDLLEKENEEDLQREIILSLGRLKEQKSAYYLLNILFSCANFELRQEVIAILGEMRSDREVLDGLESILIWDQDLEIRRKAARSLGRLGSFLSIFTLERVFLNEKDPEIKKIIVWALFRIEPEEARDFLINRLAIESDPQVLKEIIWALANIGEVGHFREMLDNFEDLPFEIQKVLIWSLSYQKNDQSQLELIKLLSYHSLPNEIILELVQILGRSRVDKSLPLLLKILRERNNEIKKIVIWALASFRNRKHYYILEKRLKKEKSPNIRDEIKKALEYIALYI